MNKRWMIALTLSLAFLMGACTTTSITTTATTTSATPTTTTTTTTAPDNLSRAALIDSIENAIPRLNAFAWGGTEPDRTKIALTNLTFLRDDLQEGTMRLTPVFLLETVETMEKILLLLESCVDADPAGSCEHQTDGMDQQLKWSIVDGAVRMDYLQTQTLLLGFITQTITTYDVVLWRTSPVFDIRHLRIGPTDADLASSETTEYYAFVEGGDWEQIRLSSTMVQRGHFDETANRTAQTTLTFEGKVLVVRSLHDEDITHAGGFDASGTLLYHDVHFGIDRHKLVITRPYGAQAAMLVNWNAFAVAGWDCVSFGEQDDPALYLGETPVGTALHVVAAMYTDESFLDLTKSYQANELDAETLSLESEGLSFTAVSWEAVRTALTVVETQGFAWIAEEGFAFDRASVEAAMRLRIDLPIDAEWLESNIAE